MVVTAREGVKLTRAAAAAFALSAAMTFGAWAAADKPYVMKSQSAPNLDGERRRIDQPAG